METFPEPEEEQVEPFYKQNMGMVLSAVAALVVLVVGGFLFASSGSEDTATDAGAADDDGDSENGDGNGSDESQEDEEEAISDDESLSAVAEDSSPRERTTTTTERPVGEVPLPSVIGADFDEALLDLFDFDVRIEREDEPSDDVPEGFIISTDPRPGELVSEQDTVLVIVSSGPE